MVLYKVPHHNYIRILPIQDPTVVHNMHVSGNATRVMTAIGSPKIKPNDILYFIKLDGIYSSCYTLNPDTFEFNEMCHIGSNSNVEIVELDTIFTFEQIRTKISRAGYGKDQLGQYREAKLCDMSDEWVKAAIVFVGEEHRHVKYYKMELEYRKKHNIFIEDIEPKS